MKLRRKRRPHDWVSSADAIRTERLRVVPITPELEAGYVALFDDEFVTTHHWSRAMVHVVQKSLRAGGTDRDLVTRATAVLVPRDDPHAVIGFISIERGPAGSADKRQFGIQIASDHRGMGYTTEVLPAIIDHIENGGFRHVVLATSEHNAAMIRVCEKLGLQFEPEPYKHPDGSEEVARVYRVLPRTPS